MAGRAFAFADPEIIALLQTIFVPVCADDWYLRRRQDSDGEFLRKVADQGPRNGKNNGTRQGIYCLTADGELLAYKNAGQDADATRGQMNDALRKWAKLPPARRDPGAVAVPAPGKPDPQYARPVPAGGLVLRVNARILDRTASGFAKGKTTFPGGEKASRDFLWLTAAEQKSLAPPRADVGHTYDVPDKIAARILRFHLADNTRGEPNVWGPGEVRSQKLTLTVTAATADAVELRLDGAALLATDADPAKAARGFDGKFRGDLRYRPAAAVFDRFDVAVLGDHWGAGDYTAAGVRPGKSLLGFSFELADPAVPADRVPPQAARDRDAYFGK